MRYAYRRCRFPRRRRIRRIVAYQNYLFFAPTLLAWVLFLDPKRGNWYNWNKQDTEGRQGLVLKKLYAFILSIQSILQHITTEKLEHACEEDSSSTSAAEAIEIPAPLSTPTEERQPLEIPYHDSWELHKYYHIPNLHESVCQQPTTKVAGM